MTDRPISGRTGPARNRQTRLGTERPASGQTDPPQDGKARLGTNWPGTGRSVPRGAERGPGPCRGGRSRRASSGARARRARPPPLTDSAPAREQLLSRNVKRFRGGLVPQAHRLLYYSTLGSRVIKRNRSPPPLTDSAPARERQQVTSPLRSGDDRLRALGHRETTGCEPLEVGRVASDERFGQVWRA